MKYAKKFIYHEKNDLDENRLKYTQNVLKVNSAETGIGATIAAGDQALNRRAAFLIEQGPGPSKRPVIKLSKFHSNIKK